MDKKGRQRAEVYQYFLIPLMLIIGLIEELDIRGNTLIPFLLLLLVVTVSFRGNRRRLQEATVQLLAVISYAFVDVKVPISENTCSDFTVSWV